MDAEAGGHRIQRIPANERKGRVHSSTVTVAVLRESPGDTASERRGGGDFEVSWFNGTVGAGGQHRNKTATAARVVHLPTGLVRTAQTRSRQNSLRDALDALARDLDRAGREDRRERENRDRSAQVGSGERSDKRRTYRFQDGLVHDHVSGRSAPARAVLSGRIDLLWA